MKYITILVLMTLLLAVPFSAFAQDTAGTQVLITVEGKTLTAEFNESQTAQDFLSQLPEELSMSRLYGREYYTTLHTALSSDGTLQHDYAVGISPIGPHASTSASCSALRTQRFQRPSSFWAK